MKLYIIRHGQTEWNTKGMWQGHSDIRLNDEGLAQAALIAQRFKDKKQQIGRIYTSPLTRAAQTAEVINRVIDTDMITRDDLKEVYLGRWEGKTVAEIIRHDPIAFKQWEEEEHPQLDFDIETYFCLRERAWAALNDIIATEGTAKDIVIVSHGAWIKALICKVLDIRLSNRMKLIVENVSLSVLEYTDADGFRVHSLNDTSHTDDL